MYRIISIGRAVILCVIALTVLIPWPTTGQTTEKSLSDPMLLLTAAQNGSTHQTVNSVKHLTFVQHSLAWELLRMHQLPETYKKLGAEGTFVIPALNKRLPYASLATPLLFQQPAHPQSQESNDRWAHTRKVLETSTLAGLWTTGLLGTVLAVNRPTLLSDGRCETGDPIFGDYGCGELSTVHGISAVTSIALYTASEVFNLTTGPKRQRSTINRVFTWIHRAGILALPLPGIVSRYPEVIGITDPGAQRDFSEVIRTIHLAVGYTTVGAYTVTFTLD